MIFSVIKILLQLLEKFFLITQKAYTDFEGRFVLIFAGIHPYRLGNDHSFIVVARLLFGIKNEPMAVAIEGRKEKVLAVDSQIGKDQAGSFGRKINDGSGQLARKRHVGLDIL